MVLSVYWTCSHHSLLDEVEKRERMGVKELLFPKLLLYARPVLGNVYRIPQCNIPTALPVCIPVSVCR